MFRRALATLVVSTISMVAACSSNTTPGGPGGPQAGGTGTPNPAFEGAPPDEPYVFQGTPGTYGGILTYSLISDPDTFNPVTAAVASSTQIIDGPIYTPLLGYDNGLQKANDGLTTGHETSADGLVWTFHIRKGVKWSDGQPFTAQDVKFTFDCAFQDYVDNSVKDSFLQSDGTLPKTEAPDDLTFVIRLGEPSALLIDNVGSTYLLPKHKWQSAYDSKTFDKALGLDTKPEDVVGLGPYRLKEFSSNQRIVLERNPYYWKVDTKGNRLPYIDRVIIQIVPDLNATLLNFQSGQTDLMWQVRPEEVESVRALEGKLDAKVYDLGPGFNTYNVVFNQDLSKPNGKPVIDQYKLDLFTNVKFRKAIAFAIDREALLKTAVQGPGAPISTWTPPANKEWYDDASVVKYAYDPNQAKALLKEIGVEDRDGDGVAEDGSGHKIEIRLFTNNSNPTRVAMATVIKDNLTAVGIGVNFQAMPFNNLVVLQQKTRDFDAVLGGWSSANPPDPVLMKNIVLSSGQLHYMWPNQKTPGTPWEKQMDELMLLNAKTLDREERKKQFAQVLHLWSDNLPEIDLIAPNYYVAAKNRVANHVPSSLPPYNYWNLDELYLTK